MDKPTVFSFIAALSVLFSDLIDNCFSNKYNVEPQFVSKFYTLMPSIALVILYACNLNVVSFLVLVCNHPIVYSIVTFIIAVSTMIGGCIDSYLILKKYSDDHKLEWSARMICRSIKKLFCSAWCDACKKAHKKFKNWREDKVAAVKRKTQGEEPAPKTEETVATTTKSADMAKSGQETAGENAETNNNVETPNDKAENGLAIT